MMRIVERMEKLGDKKFCLGRVIEKTARGYSVEANPKYIRDVIAMLGPGRLETRVGSKCEEDTNNRITGRTGDRETSRVQDSHRERCCTHVPRACGRHVTAWKETARKIAHVPQRATR